MHRRASVLCGRKRLHRSEKAKSFGKLLLSSGKEVIIEKVEVETLTEAETTYNFEVADFHTYYVSEKAVLIHNKCKYYELLTDIKEGWKDYKIVIQFPIERSKYYQIKERFVNKIYQCCIYRGLVEYQDILDEEIG